MKFRLIVCAAAVLFSAGAAQAAQAGGVPGATKPPAAAAVPECPAGFTKTEPYGTATSDHGWTCTSPVYVCPDVPGGWMGGLIGPKAAAVGAGAQISFACSYRKAPK